MSAGRRLKDIGIANVQIRVGDGLVGWKEKAPFDRIVFSCAIEEWPEELKNQLRPGGWILAPVGPARGQVLKQMIRLPTGFEETRWIPVSFLAARRKKS